MPKKTRKSRAKKDEMEEKKVEEAVEETPEVQEEEAQPEQPQEEQKMVKLVALQNWPLRDGRFARKDSLVEVSEEYSKVLLTQTRAFKLPSGDEKAQ